MFYATKYELVVLFCTVCHKNLLEMNLVQISVIFDHVLKAGRYSEVPETTLELIFSKIPSK